MSYSHSWWTAYAQNNSLLSGSHIFAYISPCLHCPVLALTLTSLIWTLLFLLWWVWDFFNSRSVKPGRLGLDQDAFWVFEVGQKYRSNRKCWEVGKCGKLNMVPSEEGNWKIMAHEMGRKDAGLVPIRRTSPCQGQSSLIDHDIFSLEPRQGLGLLFNKVF